ERLFRLAQDLVGLAPCGPSARIRRILLEDDLASPEEDLRVLRVSQGVPLAAKRVEVIGRDDPEALERRVGVLSLAEGEQGSAFVFQGPRMVRLNREDRVARDDEIGPPLGPQEEIPLRLESVVRSWLHGQETVQGGERFLAAIQLDARVSFRVQRAGVPRIEGDDLRRLLDDLVPSGEGPERLEPPDPRSERLRSEADRSIVGADRIDASADLAQQFGAARPPRGVAVPLAEGLVVGSQRLVVLIR